MVPKSGHLVALICLAVLFLRAEGLLGPRRVKGPSTSSSRHFATFYKELSYNTLHGIHFTDLTPDLRAIVEESGIQEGTVNVLSRHTTCGITINEMEERLVDDTYLHNDLHLRSGPPDWPGGDEAWRAQEPINAHSHLLVMLLGASETVPIHKGELKIGTWQSVILAEFDGARTRTVAVQVTGD
jgi:secondary thiamine-phosphate synthase enzyme